ncbi:MAG: tRNA (adenosine(37)-N6)-dimethylallyltransferase MiaA [Hyphomonadaceae bacterium]
MRPAILIHGPTASGKTKLAIALARRHGGEIINADAMQCYADLNVLTARPDAEELAAAPHHLFGTIDASTRHSAAAWARDAAAKIAELTAADRTPIVVGGTGLYLSALTDGLSDVPNIPDDVRDKARATVEADPAAAWAHLIAHDPHISDRIDSTDKQRMARALEVLLTTGKPLSSFHGHAAPLLPPGGWIGVTLTPPRETLYERINARVDVMMRHGALEEARRLWERRLDSSVPAMRAHGMPGFSDYFEGRTSLESAVERCKRDTRRYAKRQMTWIAHQFTLWPRIPSEAPDVRTRVASDIWAEIQG